MKKVLFISLGIAALVLFACQGSYRSQSLAYKQYRIHPAGEKDSVLLTVIKPYSDSINRSMNDVVGVAAETLDKNLPECTLGNFMADAYFVMGAEKYGTRVDVAFMNYGGIRLTQLPAGNVTRGKIYELMPFDNVLILQRLTGRQLLQLLDHIAGRGGWPVAGITMGIKDRKAVDVLVGGKPVDPAAIYTTLNSDFVANGGDDADMLRGIPREDKGYLMRTALFDYIDRLKSQGKKITVSSEKRLTYVQ